MRGMSHGLRVKLKKTPTHSDRIVQCSQDLGDKLESAAAAYAATDREFFGSISVAHLRWLPMV